MLCFFPSILKKHFLFIIVTNITAVNNCFIVFFFGKTINCLTGFPPWLATKASSPSAFQISRCRSKYKSYLVPKSIDTIAANISTAVRIAKSRCKFPVKWSAASDKPKKVIAAPLLK